MRKLTGIKLFQAVFFLVALVKVFLIADQEIFGQRFDDMGYAMSMLDYYYACNPNANWLFIRPLSFPLFGAFCMESGIPYRLCIEFLFLASSYFFCTGLMRVVNLTAVPVTCLLALVFHPWVLSGFNQLLTEPFYFCLILIVLGIVVRLLERYTWRWSNGWLWTLGILMAIMMLARREQPWAFGFLLLLFLARLLLLRFKQGRDWKAGFKQMVLILIPVGTYVAIILLVSGLNYAKWGIFATNEQQAPGFSGLLDTLYKIETPDPSIWAPVTTRTLEMAMEASPRFDQLREGLFNQNNPHLEYGEGTTGRKGELGAWMWWRLYDSLASSGIYTSPRDADAWMQATSEELELAMKEGRLPKRRFSTSFPLDPNFGIWMPEFPKLFINTLKRLSYDDVEPDFIPKEVSIPSMYYPIFNNAANRRISRLSDNSVEVTGHAFSSAGRLDFIGVKDIHGDMVASASPQGFVYWKLPEIERLTGKKGLIETAFYISFIPRTEGPYTLGFWKDGKLLHSYALGARKYPHRMITKPEDDLPVVDFTIQTYRSPYPDTSESMRAMLDGWAFTSAGALTHVSMVNSLGQFLKLQTFTIERNDILSLYNDTASEPAATPLGFHVETPVLDESSITVQFWKDKLKVHEIPLKDLPEGHWGTIDPTASGVPMTIGIGKRQIPELVEVKSPLRERIRAHVSGHYNLYLIFLVILSGLAGVTARVLGSRRSLFDRWIAGIIIAYIAFFLLGRAVFYGLVEAAVVPGVSRYMDCASPVASILLALLVFMPILIGYEIFLLKTSGKAASGKGKPA